MEKRYIDLAVYELNKAEKDFKTAQDVFNILGDFETAVNKSYYAMFHLMTAAVALKGVQCRKHVGLMRTFQKEFILTGIIDKEMAKFIHQNEELRNEADYKRIDELREVTKEEAWESIMHTADFYGKVKPVILALKDECERSADGSLKE